jgi:hypothetical protein
MVQRALGEILGPAWVKTRMTFSDNAGLPLNAGRSEEWEPWTTLPGPLPGAHSAIPLQEYSRLDRIAGAFWFVIV